MDQSLDGVRSDKIHNLLVVEILSDDETGVDEIVDQYKLQVMIKKENIRRLTKRFKEFRRAHL